MYVYGARFGLISTDCVEDSFIQLFAQNDKYNKYKTVCNAVRAEQQGSKNEH